MNGGLVRNQPASTMVNHQNIPPASCHECSSGSTCPGNTCALGFRRAHLPCFWPKTLRIVATRRTLQGKGWGAGGVVHVQGAHPSWWQTGTDRANRSLSWWSIGGELYAVALCIFLQRFFCAEDTWVEIVAPNLA